MPGGEEVKTGPPVAELRELRETPQPGFFGRIRNSIDRRRLGSELTELSWKGMVLVVVEFLDLAFQLFAGSKSDRNRR